MVETIRESKESVSLLRETLKNYFGNVDTDVTVERMMLFQNVI